MGKILNILKKYSFGGYKTGLYRNEVITFGSLLSVILSTLFLFGFLTGVSIYSNEIFIQRLEQIAKQETKLFSQTELSSYFLPQALEQFPNVTLSVALSKKENITCNNLSIAYICNQVEYFAKFDEHNSRCTFNLYQNDQVIENCGKATNQSGFFQFEVDQQMFQALTLPILVQGLDSKMLIILQYNSKQVLSNGQLVDRYSQSIIDIYGGTVYISQNMIEYKNSSSIFELVFSRQQTQYYPDLNSINIAQYQYEQNGTYFQLFLNPTVQSFQVQPKQFYEIFPLIGALLGLFKLFSLVSMYNQHRFEKDLEASLTQPKELEEDKEEGKLLQPSNPFDEFALNKSAELPLYQQRHPQNQEANLKHKELYSFNTIKELYQNVKQLMTSSKSKEARLNQHQKLLNDLSNDSQRLETQGNETSQQLNTAKHEINAISEQLQMREQEIRELRNQQEQLINKNLNLERNNSELWSRIASLDFLYQEQNSQIKKLMISQNQEQPSLKQEFEKKND